MNEARGFGVPSFPHAFVPVALALAAFALYGQALGFGFVMDDWRVIVENPRLGQLGLVDIFSRGAWASTPFPTDSGDHYRPIFILWLSLWVKLGGGEAWWLHGASVAVHAANTVLVYAVGRRLSPAAAGAAAFIFALMPIHAEAIAWISGVADLLTTAFALGAVVLWLEWEAGKRRAALAGAVVCCALAALTKETGILAPLALALVHVATRQSPRPWLWRGWLPTLAGPALALSGRWLAIGASGVESGLALDASRLMRLADAALYAVQGLVFGTPQPVVFAPVATWFTTGLVVPAAVVAAWAVWRADRRLTVLGLGWTAVFVAPALVLTLHDHAAFATRMVYLPSVGAALVLGHAVTTLRPRLRLVALAVYTLMAVPLALWHVQDWRDDGTFYGHVIASNPAHGGGYLGLARHHLRSRDVAAAEAVYQQALAALPTGGHQASLRETYALFLAERGRFADAAEQYRHLAAAPATRVAGMVGLGNAAWAMGDIDGAVRHYRAALAIDPRDATARANLTALMRSR